MVPPQFGEVQYMIDLMGELQSRYDETIIGFPYYPTSKKEKWVGSDVILTRGLENIPLITVFMQFKRADKLISGNAGHRSDFGSPYFQFKIHTANQHNTLVRLNDELGVAGYVAPGFHKLEERLNYLENNEILEQSLFIEPDKTATGDNHKICYTMSPVDAAMYSAPEDLESATPVHYVFDEVLDSGAVFETFEEQQRLFGDFRSQLIERLEYIPQDEYRADEEIEDVAVWIQEQRRFYQRYLDIYPQFLLDPKDSGGYVVIQNLP